MYKYTQVKTLGRGGFGSAILATRKDTRENVVIKEVRLSGLSRKEVEDARKEAAFLSTMHHPNIVGYIESFTEANKLFIVMEYCDGGDLAGRIAKLKKERKAMSEEEALSLFVQLCLAVKHIHDRRIIHRDLKSANIFLTASGVVKLGDLGIARSLSSSAEMAKTQIGTPYFLSPELCLNAPCEFAMSYGARQCVCAAALQSRRGWQAPWGGASAASPGAVSVHGRSRAFSTTVQPLRSLCHVALLTFFSPLLPHSPRPTCRRNTPQTAARRTYGRSASCSTSASRWRCPSPRPTSRAS